jgi:isoleucyl-tRNA synthetase
MSTNVIKNSKVKKNIVAGKYSKTVLLPQTNFNQRANSLKREPELQKWWNDNKIYSKLSENNSGEEFILHDGPPYANGGLHIGHAMNKILKDFINKYQTLKGRKVRYIPGWDCHGLPIELKVLQKMKSKEREELTPLSLRTKAAEFAKETVCLQRDSFKRYGVWGDWDNPYLTLQSEYEASQIKVFGEMLLRGHIYRGKKPVHWSPSSRTALAEAELEYPENHISQSIYVGFQVIKPSSALANALKSRKTTTTNNISNNNLQVAIWTTTPWTIPSNLAIAVNADLDYCLVSHSSYMGGTNFIVAKNLVESFSSKISSNQNLEIESEILKGSDLVGTVYQHPLFDRQSKIIIGGDYITTESGTGLVHTAPGHGSEDFLVGLKLGLPLLSPVNDLGCFTEEVGERFSGLKVLEEGNEEVIKALNESGSLLCQEAYNHKYPYDWRTQKPTIMRATEQWFASVNTFRDDALKAIETVQWIPPIGRNRIYSMIESRGDWCISRQRSWGVPIPVFYNKKTNESLLTPETINHIESLFLKHGSNSWWEMSVSDLLPEGPLRKAADSYTKGTDTMDVWFDSGTSWSGVLLSRGLSYPADLYLEGSDQHRGWFQSSLLTSVASQGVAPFKKVLTHGFVLDEKGLKMSKSLGNVVDPVKIIEGGNNQKENPAYGADTLRLWVSGVDYTHDVCIGSNIMKQSSDSYRKLRNTLRYLIGSLSDFDPVNDSIPTDQLPSIDQYILGLLTKTLNEVERSYDDYQFYKANQAFIQFATSELSSFYLDIAKDRLYISNSSEYRRRSCQTVIHILLEQLAVMISPIVPHMAEDVWQNLPYSKPTSSVFEKGWINKQDRYPPFEEDFWRKVRLVRNDFNRCTEIVRQAKVVGASQESQIVIHTSDEEMKNILVNLQGDKDLLAIPKLTNGIDDLRFLFLTSQVSIVNTIEELIEKCPYNLTASESESGITIGVSKASGKKCERCWFYSENVGHDDQHSDICLRCANIVRKL